MANVVTSMAVASTHATLITADISQKSGLGGGFYIKEDSWHRGKYDAINHTNYPGDDHKALAELGVHYGHIVQRLADSIESIIWHHGQKDAFTWVQCHISEKLKGTTAKGNFFIFAPDTDQHLWDYICGITEIQDGHISKEEVHGGLEIVIWERQQDDGLISHEGHSVEKKDNPRDHHLDLRLPCESKEYKTTEVAIIDHSVFS